MKIEKFSDVTAKTDSVLYKRFHLKNFGEFNINYLAVNCMLSTKGTFKKSQALLSYWIQLWDDNRKLKIKANSQGFNKAALDFTHKLKNCKLSSKIVLTKDIENNINPNIGVKYKSKQNLSAINWIGGLNSLNLTWIYTVSKVAIGADCNYQNKEFSYNAALWFRLENMRALIGKFKKYYEIHLYKKIDYKTHFASKLSWNSRKALLEIGGDYCPSHDAVINYKLSSLGDLSFSYSKNLNMNISFTISSSVNTKSLADSDFHSHKFGFLIDFNY
ncbi:unnamed protein product [Blepharisma stoltei]|uniref:Uncharacterized protein n=1 Tax=Blepharisma stoltei TaxID=1481888 RepID=A0AAU9K5G6_9CILI|nr:unnamed protein product [Blepharisma stoltei]